MKRFYVCDIVLDQDPDGGPVYRAYLSRNRFPEITAVSAVIPTGPDGVPLRSWCLAIVAAPDHRRFRNDPKIDPMPDVSLDVEYNAVDRGAALRIADALRRRGATVPAAGPGDGYRAFVRGLGRQLEPTYDENAHDVREG